MKLIGMQRSYDLWEMIIKPPENRPLVRPRPMSEDYDRIYLRERV